MLKAVRALPSSFGSRAEAIDGLVGAGFPERVGMWMTANLRRAGDRYQWKLDFDALELLLCDFLRTDLWTVLEAPPADTQLHFVRATESEVLTEPEAARIEGLGTNRPVYLHEVEGGHWLNSDNPDAVISLLEQYLPGA